MPRRTAQRQLSRLVDEQKIVAAGQARARRYHAAPDIDASASKSADDDFSYADGRYMIASREHNRELIYKVIPLSPDSRDILTYIDQPLLARKPVGYQPEFLNAYEPNKTWYLPEPLRRQLKKMGDTGQGGLPAGTYGHAILNRLLIDLSWASSHLEGNTYTRLDTRELIEHGTAAQGKAALETQMILNHKAAIELLVENADSVDFNRFTILNLHSALSENLLPNPADEGRVRQHVVEISQSVYRPLSVPAQIDEALDMLLDKASQIEDPFEQSFFVMVHVPYLQPFADINKRVSRLAANLPLIRANLCPLTFLDVPEKAYSSAILGVYEMTRIELLRDLYVWAYERSTQEYLALKQELAEPDPLRLAYRTLIKQTIHDIVVRPDDDALAIIEQSAALHAAKSDRMNVQALIVEELRRLHEGVLARYGLRPSEFSRWREKMAGK
ncbi:Fic family protein [Collimonas sp.]|uniref:Fic family protein n=1 Tax=Collimonas sp. TaxID=1963772 RepID=UPI0032632E15